MNTCKELLINCGWAKDFMAVISEWEAERLCAFKDVDDMIIYADHLALDHNYDGAYFEGEEV